MILNLKRVTVTAYAKINLYLKIEGKRADGYHDIDTVMQSVTLGDTVIVKPAEKLTLDCKNADIPEKDNIAYKAARLFFEKTGISGGAKIKIIKRIPTAAGLGGGSADAAAVLAALDKLYNTDLSGEELEGLALTLGADVPFFIKGGTARARGVGEILTPLKSFNTGFLLLAKNGTKPSTAEMYRLTDGKESIKLDTDALINAIENNDIGKLSALAGNSFACVWENDALKEKLSELGADFVSLSGSGPVWFGLFADKKAALTAYKKLKSENTECYLAKPCNFALKID